jgi:hypothetical protein
MTMLSPLLTDQRSSSPATACRHRATRLQVIELDSSYNKDSHELLVDPGFDGGVAVGARRPRFATTATSHRAFGDKVSSATTASATGPRDIEWSEPQRAGAESRCAECQ